MPDLLPSTALPTDHPIRKRLAQQLSSGRWILTVLAGCGFFAFTIVVAYVIFKQRSEFKPETLVAMFTAVLLVIQGVYKDYFNKNGEDKKQS